MAQSTVKLIVDAQNAIRPLQKTDTLVKTLANSTDKLKNKLNGGKKSFDNLGNSGKRAATGVNTLTGTLKKLAAAFAVIQTAKFVFFKTAELETQRKSLEQLTGSVEKTNSIITELQEFGAVTPFTSSELIEQTKRLKAFGFATDELVDTTKRLSDVAGATGADLTGIATAFGQIRAKGKLQQEENLQLLERGVDITTELKRITGLQGDAFESAMRKGEIGADLVNQALINLTSEGAIFAGGATKQADTLNGKFSTLQDSVDTLARTIGTELQDEIKGVIDLATDGVKAIDDFVKRISVANKIGRPELAGIAMEARGEATKIVRAEGGLFQSLLPKNQEKIKILTEEIKKRKINAALAQHEADLEAKKLETSKLIDQTVTKTHETIIGRPPVQLEIIKKDIETNQNLEKQVSFFDTINEGLFTEIELIDIANSKFTFQNEQAAKLKQQFDAIGQSVEDNLVQNLTDAVMGAQTLGDALSNVLKGLQRQLIEMAMQKAVGGIGGAFSGFLGNIFGGGGGGATSLITDNVFSTGFDTSGLFKKARGGPVSAGGAFLVGERGPEILQMGSKGGNIIPNNKIGGNTTNVVVNVDASGTQAEGDDQSSRQLGELIAAAVQSEIVRQQMSGGLLS